MRFYERKNRQPSTEIIVDSIIDTYEFIYGLGLQKYMNRGKANIDYDSGIEIQVDAPNDSLFKISKISDSERIRRIGKSNLFYREDPTLDNMINDNFAFYAEQIYSDIRGMEIQNNEVNIIFSRDEPYETLTLEMTINEFIKNFDLSVVNKTPNTINTLI
jgi:hypothetical protein